MPDYAKNKDKIRERKRAYYKANPHKRREYEHRKKVKREIAKFQMLIMRDAAIAEQYANDTAGLNAARKLHTMGAGRAEAIYLPGENRQQRIARIQRERYWADPEKAREKLRQVYRETDKTKHAERKRAWRAANADYVREYRREWYARRKSTAALEELANG